MKVILNENVTNLGNVGDIVNVSPGHARNYLIPSKLALVADEQNKQQLEHQQKRLAKKMNEAKTEAQGLKAKLDGIELDFTRRVAGNGKLFGAVSTQDIAKALKDKDLEIEKRMLHLPVAIKTTGTFDVVARLFKDVEAEFKVNVAMDPKQAEEIRKKQEAAAKKKKEKAAKEEEKATEGETSEEAPKTEEQKLDDETNKVIRE